MLGPGERGQGPSSLGSSGFSQRVQRFSTAREVVTLSLLGVFGNLGGYSFSCYVQQSESNQESEHTAVGTGKLNIKNDLRGDFLWKS